MIQKYGESLSHQATFNQVDIFAMRILLKKVLLHHPIFFNVESGMVIPVDVNILEGIRPDIYENMVADILITESEKIDTLLRNNAPTAELIDANEKLADIICSLRPPHNDPFLCIENVILYFDKDSQKELLCNEKVTLKFRYKIILILSSSCSNFGLVILPQDEDTKFLFGNNVVFPIEYISGDVHTILNIDPTNQWFELTIKFSLPNTISICSIDAYCFPPLQSKLLIKNIKSEFDILDKVCTCDLFAGTHTLIKTTADIIDLIGIMEDIILNGISTST